jgi:hypothetical protein
MKIFNGKIEIEQGSFGSINVTNKLKVTDIELCTLPVIQQWNAGIDMLMLVIKNTYKSSRTISFEHKIGDSLKEMASKFPHEASDFISFEANALCGEFYCGSNCHGTLNLEDGSVCFTSHGLESFEYKSLRDFYDHYELNKPVEYGYSTLIGSYDEVTNKITFEADNYAELLKDVKIDIDGADIFSDVVQIPALLGFNNRNSIIEYKGISL